MSFSTDIFGAPGRGRSSENLVQQVVERLLIAMASKEEGDQASGSVDECGKRSRNDKEKLGHAKLGVFLSYIRLSPSEIVPLYEKPARSRARP